MDCCIRGEHISRYHSWVEYTTFFGNKKVKCFWCGEKSTLKHRDKDMTDRISMLNRYQEMLHGKSSSNT
jgi:hypothetical protein